MGGALETVFTNGGIMIRKHQPEVFGAACVALVLSGYVQVSVAQGENQLEEVIVTALKTETNLQDTPVTVATVGGEELASQSVADLRDALNDVPGLVFTSVGNFGMQVSARGVGPGIARGQGGMSTLFDGVYSSSQIAWRVGYYDVSRIEVLLGPQGTLYGRNAEGGVVNLVTNNPTHEIERQITAGIGNYGLRNIQGMANVPLADTLSLRIAGSYNSRDGYLSNGQNDNGSAGLRAKLLYEPTDGLSILVGGEHYNVDEKGQAPVGNFVTPTRSVFTVPYTDKQFYRREANRLWAEINADVGIGNLTLIPAYVKTKEADELTYAPAPGGAFQSIAFGEGSAREKSFEARLSSDPSSTIQWVAGAYFYRVRDFSPGDSYGSTSDISVSNRTIVLRPGARDDYVDGTQRSKGYFAQATVPIVERLRVIGGIRYSNDKARYFNDGAATVAADIDARWTHTDYRAGLQYDVAPQSMVYATVSSGYRPGGFSPAPPFPAYDIEEITSYELGSKNELLDGRLRINGDVFYYDYQGYQQVTFQSCVHAGDPNPGNLPLCTGGPNVNAIIQNVEKVSVIGGELAAQFAPTGDDRVNVNLSYNDSEIKSPLFVANTSPFDLVNVQGNHLPYVPIWAGNLGYEHDFAVWGGRLTPQAGASYQDAVNLALPEIKPGNNQAAVWQFDASVSFAPDDGKWRANVWGRNLSNEIVRASVNGGSTYLAPPRTYGITFSTSF